MYIVSAIINIKYAYLDHVTIDFYIYSFKNLRIYLIRIYFSRIVKCFENADVFAAQIDVNHAI
jgi:hypothetical protein